MNCKTWTGSRCINISPNQDVAEREEAAWLNHIILNVINKVMEKNFVHTPRRSHHQHKLYQPWWDFVCRVLTGGSCKIGYCIATPWQAHYDYSYCNAEQIQHQYTIPSPLVTCFIVSGSHFDPHKHNRHDSIFFDELRFGCVSQVQRQETAD